MGNLELKNPMTQELMAQLKAWCDQKHGRRVEVAQALDVSPQTVSDWFAGRKQPMGEQALKIQAMLRNKWRSR